MADALWNGRRFRTFNVLDDYNRETLRTKIDTSLPALRIVRALTELSRSDVGPPGKPNQNACIERFNGAYRDEILDRYVFETLERSAE